MPLDRRYSEVRAATEALCAGLAVEDQVAQSMPDASPLKWHLAHTSWFFEDFVLAARAGYRPFHPQYHHLFNSYYEAVGERWPRAERGLLTRQALIDAACTSSRRTGLTRPRLGRSSRVPEYARVN